MRATLVAIGAVVALFVAVAALSVVLASWPHTSRSTVVVSTPAPLGVASPEVRRIPLPARFDAAAIYARRSPGVVTIYSVFAGQEEQGSGFVVSRGGVILTNSHVVSSDGTRASAVAVRFADGDRIPATIVGYDVFDDVGVIRVDPKAHALAPLPLGSSAAVRVGEPVAVIGSPFGNENSLTVGVVSATRSIPSITSRFQLPDAIQTDAAVNHGNSGGPLFDAAGRVIGITAQIRSDTGAAEGVAFAVPIDAARRSLRELLDHGSVRYAYVGITSESLVPSVAHRFGFGVARGAVITGIADDGPAAGAGFHAATKERTFAGGRAAADGDVVVAIDGLPVRSSDDLVRIVSERLRPGQLATFTIVRGRARKTIAVRLATRTRG